MKVSHQLRLVVLFSLCVTAPVLAAPAVGPVTSSTSVLPVGGPVPLVVTAQIVDPTVITASVSLQRLNSGGQVVAVLGSLRDEGTNGDKTAGDSIYSTTVNFTEPTAGSVRLAVSAAFRGVMKRVTSTPIAVDIVQADGYVVLDAEGGTLRVESGAWSGALVTVPPNALSKTTVIVARAVTDPIDATNPDPVLELLPHGLQFAAEVVVGLPTAQSTLETIQRAEPREGEWTTLGDGLCSGYLRCGRVSSFSWFRLFRAQLCHYTKDADGTTATECRRLTDTWPAAPSGSPYWPVLLVHGVIPLESTFVHPALLRCGTPGAEYFGDLPALLLNEPEGPFDVWELRYDSFFGIDTLGAQVLSNAVHQLRHSTGRSQATIVAHSLGGLVSRAYVQSGGGASTLSRLVTIGTPHLGSWAANACALAHTGGATCRSCWDMMRPAAVNPEPFVRQLADASQAEPVPLAGPSPNYVLLAGVNLVEMVDLQTNTTFCAEDTNELLAGAPERHLTDGVVSTGSALAQGEGYDLYTGNSARQIYRPYPHSSLLVTNACAEQPQAAPRTVAHAVYRDVVGYARIHVVDTINITGTITKGGSPLSNVTIALSGAANMTTTSASDGTYAFAGLPLGSYTLTPSAPGTTFTPAERILWDVQEDVAAQDFVADGAGAVESIPTWDPPLLPDRPEQYYSRIIRTGSRQAANYIAPADATNHRFWALSITYGWSGNGTNSSYCVAWGGCTRQRSVVMASIPVMDRGLGKVMHFQASPYVPNDYDWGPAAGRIFLNFVRWASKSRVILLTRSTSDSTVSFFEGLLASAGIAYSMMTASDVVTEDLSDAVLIAGFTATPSEYGVVAQRIMSAVNGGSWLVGAAYGGYVLQYGGVGTVSIGRWSPMVNDTAAFVVGIDQSPLFGYR